MQVRASSFASFKAAARLAAASALACAALTGCASTSSQAKMEIVRADLHASAQDFAMVAQARGWTGEAGQGAVSTLLNGRSQNAPTPTEAYLSTKGRLDMPMLAQAVIVDLDAAAFQTQSLAAVAEACASAPADAVNARANLTALERALIIAKRARMVLASAFDRVHMVLSPSDAKGAAARLASLEAQIERLDAAADKFADKQRGA